MRRTRDFWQLMPFGSMRHKVWLNLEMGTSIRIRLESLVAELVGILYRHAVASAARDAVPAKELLAGNRSLL